MNYYNPWESNWGPYGSLKSFGDPLAPPATYGSVEAAVPLPAPVPVSPPATAMMPSPGVSMTQTGLAAEVQGATPSGTTLDPEADTGGWLRNTFMNKAGGLDLKNIGSLAQTIGAFGQLWAGIQANRVARETLDFNKRAFNTNMRNQTQSYNTALSDRATSRYVQNGNPDGAAEYIEANRLSGGNSNNKKKKTSLSSGISAFGKEE